MLNKNYFNILIGLYVTEKTVRLLRYGQITFKVSCLATKFDIKKAVEFIFNFNVFSVSLINVKRKQLKMNRGGKKMYRKKWRKAIVAIDGSILN